ncbi:MAG: hypothetical protein L0177_10660, partial [Chloroflexi bacterium]|nr:hypothetical protein [Chloroflexota bacterium]
FSGLTSLEAGERKQISLVYDLPASVLRKSDGSLVYELFIQKQPGVQSRKVSVEVALPEGYRLAGSSVPPTVATASRVGFSLDLTRDTILSVNLERLAAESAE